MFKDSLWNVSDRVRWTPNQFQFWKCVHFWKNVFLLFHFKTSKYPKNIRMRPMWCLNFNFSCFKVSRNIQRYVTTKYFLCWLFLSTCSALGYFHTSTFGAHSGSFDGRVRFVYIKCSPNLGVHPWAVHESGFKSWSGVWFMWTSMRVSASLQQKLNSA